MPEPNPQPTAQPNVPPKPDVLSPSKYQMDLIYAIRRSAKIECDCEVCQLLREINKVMDMLKPGAVPGQPQP